MSEKTIGSGKKKGFNPGAHEVAVKVVGQRNAAVTQRFSLNEQPVVTLAKTVASAAHATELQVSNDPVDPDVFEELVLRMTWILVAKKLTIATSPEDAAISSRLSALARAEIFAPTALLPVINGFGAIETEAAQWRMFGQLNSAFSFFMRAAGPDEIVFHGVGTQVNRQSDYFVNANWSNPFGPLREFCAGVINAWVQEGVDFTFNVGQGQCTVKVPEFVSGAAEYLTFTAMAQKPVKVIWALRVTSLIEGIGNNAITVQDVNAFAGQRVLLCSYRGEDMAGMVDSYIVRVQSRIQAAMSGWSGWGPVQGMGRSGDDWQLGRSFGNGAITSPGPLVSKDKNIGWFMAGNTGYQTSVYSWIQHSEISQMQAMVNYVQGMKKRKD